MPTPRRMPRLRSVQLRFAKIVVADHLRALLQASGIIAAVVFERIVVAIKNPDAVGILVFLDEIAPAHFGGVHAELARDPVHDFFHHVDRLRPARAAHHHSGHFVGVNRFEFQLQIGNFVRSGNRRQGDPRNDQDWCCKRRYRRERNFSAPTTLPSLLNAASTQWV